MTTLAISPVQGHQPVPRGISLSDTAQRLYDALRNASRTIADHRGYSVAVTHVHFFAPGEIVADALCMARSTLYRKIAELKAADLIDARAHYVTHEGRTRADGMVWAVKMHHERQGRVSVPYDALKKSYRCLSADIANGRTAFRQIGQSKELQEKQVDIEKILAWALPPSTTQKPVTSMTVRCDLEQILDVPYADKQDRNTAVDGAARALSASLGDAGSVMFFRWLLWRLLRLEDKSQGGHWHTVYEMARRASVDAQEGFAVKAGALFVSRLKQAPWWELLKSQPPSRVGSVPANAARIPSL